MKIKALILMVFLVAGHAFATINSQVNRNNNIGDGNASSFPFTFKIFEEDQIQVFVADTVTDQEYQLILDADFEVSGVGETNGGAVNLLLNCQGCINGTNKLTSGFRITLKRNVELIQQTDIRNQGVFFPSTHEDQFDYLTMIDQQQQDILDRGIRLPETESSFNPVLPLPVDAGSVIKINQTGDGFVAEPSDDTFDLLAPTTTKGDMVAHDGITNVRVPVGTNDQVLTADDGSVYGVSYKTIDITSVNNGSAGGDGNKLEAKGDIWVFDGTTVSTLGVAPDGQALVTDAASDSGVRWNTIDIASVSPLSGKGDLLSHDGTANNVVNVGANDQVLVADDGAIEGMRWGTIDIASVTPLTADGDLLTHDGTISEVLPRGADGQILTASTDGGLSWEDAPSSSPTTLQGDMIYNNGIVDVALPIGGQNQVLTVSTDGIPSWEDATGGAGGGDRPTWKLTGAVGVYTFLDGYWMAEGNGSFNEVRVGLLDSGLSGSTHIRLHRNGPSGSASSLLEEIVIPATGGESVTAVAINSIPYSAGDYFYIETVSAASGADELTVQLNQATGGGGGGGDPVEIQDSGSTVTLAVETIDFSGAGLKAIAHTPNIVTVSTQRDSAHYNVMINSNYGIETGAIEPFIGFVTDPTVTSTATDVGFQDFALRWEPTTPDTLTSATVAIPPGLYSGQCEARIFAKGGTNALTFKVTNGAGTDLASKQMSQPTVYKEEKLLFVCPSSGNVRIEVVASGSISGNPVFLDEAYIGEALDNTEASIATDWTSYSPTVTGFGTITASKFVYRRVGDSLEVNGYWTNGTVAAEVASIALPSGLTIDDTKFDRGNNTGAAGHIVGEHASVNANGAGPIVTATADGTGDIRVFFGHRYSDVNSLIPQNGNSMYVTSDKMSVKFMVPIKGWSSKSAAAPVEIQGWFVEASIHGNGSATQLGGSTAASDELNDGSLVMAKVGDSAPVEIPCLSGTASAGLTCDTPGVDEVYGVVFDAPLPGTYQVCFYVSHYAAGNDDADVIQMDWTIKATANNDKNTVEATASLQRTFYDSFTTGTGGTGSIQPLCGSLKFSNAGQKTVRLFKAPTITGTIASNEFTDASSAFPSRITVHPLAPYMQAPKVISSLNTPSETQTFKLMSAHLDLSGSADCVLTREYGTWINEASTTRGGLGICNITINDGVFSAAPICSCTGERAGLDSCAFTTTAVTATAIEVTLRGDAAGANQDGKLHIQCHGPG